MGPEKEKGRRRRGAKTHAEKRAEMREKRREDRKNKRGGADYYEEDGEEDSGSNFSKYFDDDGGPSSLYRWEDYFENQGFVEEEEFVDYTPGAEDLAYMFSSSISVLRR